MHSIFLLATILLTIHTGNSLDHICSVDSLSHNAQETPSSASPYGTLPWLVYPMAAPVFLDTYYQQSPVYFQRRNQNHHKHSKHPNFQFYTHINRLVGRKSKRTKTYLTARATRAGKEVQPFQYWRSPEVISSYPSLDVKQGQRKSDKKSSWDPAALDYLYKEGYTLNYAAIEAHWKTPFLFTALIKRLGIYPRLNLYVTPKQEKGFNTHFDSHDVFVLQTKGAKHWKVYASVVEYPVTDWSDSKLETIRSTLTTPIIDVVLQAGDALYIPRGYVHEAECDQGEDGSTHVTVGFMTMKVADLFFVAVREAKDTLDSQQRKAYKTWLVQATKEQVHLRRSAVARLCVNDKACTVPGERLVELYRKSLSGFIENLPGYQQAEKALTRALKWRRGTMKKLARRSMSTALPLLRPVTHNMQETRAKIELPSE